LKSEDSSAAFKFGELYFLLSDLLWGDVDDETNQIENVQNAHDLLLFQGDDRDRVEVVCSQDLDGIFDGGVLLDVKQNGGADGEKIGDVRDLSDDAVVTRHY